MTDKSEYTIGDIKKLFAIISDLDDIIAVNLKDLDPVATDAVRLIRVRIKDARILVEDPITDGQARELDRLASELGVGAEQLKCVAIIRDAVRRAVG
jgi:hypothetical protein